MLALSITVILAQLLFHVTSSKAPARAEINARGERPCRGLQGVRGRPPARRRTLLVEPLPSRWLFLEKVSFKPTRAPAFPRDRTNPAASPKPPLWAVRADRVTNLSKLSCRAAPSSSFFRRAAWHSARCLLLRLSLSPSSAWAAWHGTAGRRRSADRSPRGRPSKGPVGSLPHLAGSLLTGEGFVLSSRAQEPLLCIGGRGTLLFVF